MTTTATAPRRRHLKQIMRFGTAATLTGALVAAGIAIDLPNPFESASSEATTAERDTATVSTADLQTSFDAEGELSYIQPQVIVADSPGTLTDIAAENSLVQPGDVLFTIDDRPVVLLEGNLPAYRSLRVGDEGPDVEQLEKALVEMGYDPSAAITVDETYTTNTANLVERLQDDIGAPITGELALGDVIFINDIARVGAAQLRLGDSVTPGTAIVELTSVDRQITFTVPAHDAESVAIGTAIEGRLPNRSTFNATISDSRRLSTGDIAVTAQPNTGAAIPSFDQIPVDLSWSTPLANGLLTVPASALIRLDRGNYAVEVVGTDGTTTFVTVVTGMSAGRIVEISGPGIAVGTTVVAP